MTAKMILCTGKDSVTLCLNDINKAEVSLRNPVTFMHEVDISFIYLYILNRKNYALELIYYIFDLPVNAGMGLPLLTFVLDCT